MTMEEKAISKSKLALFWGKVKALVNSAVQNLYTKPSGGIPKNDLSDEVKTSLGKADTALQSFTESDPTVPAWAKQPNKPSYTASEVGALPDTTKYAGSQSVGGAANTALKLGTSTVGGTTQGIYLNQGVPAACESYDMWYMKHIAALYGATRNDATGLWSYYYRGCARWDDTQEKIVWDRYIGYDDITDEEMMSMVDHRLTSLAATSVYGSGKDIISKIAFHFIGYGNNQGGSIVAAYIGNRTITTYGYVGQKGSASGGSYYSFALSELNLVYNVKHIIGRSSYGSGATAPASATKLEYVTISYSANNKTIDFSVCPNLEFVSVMYTVSNGLTYTGCTLILHPDVYAKIFDSTNADYALWHKIDLANQARTNPITIQSA